MTEPNVARPGHAETTAPPETGKEAARPERADFREFYALTSARMLTRAIMICGSRQDAEDVVADAYLEAFRHWDRVGRYDPRAAEKWVHTTMQRRWWKVAGRRRRREAGELEVPVRPHSSPEETAEVAMVLGALPSLREHERIVVLAHCVYGLSQKEIAEGLGVKSALVAVYLFQARRRLERLVGVSRPSRRPAERFARLTGRPGAPAPLDDPLAVLLRAAWSWLAEAFEDDATGVEGVHRAIETLLRGEEGGAR